MLTTPSKSSGFTLIELMIGIAIFALALSLGVSSFRVWIQNTQIRNAAESILTGLQRSRSEAVKLNTNVEFNLVGTNSAWSAMATVSGVPTTLDSSSGREGSKNVTATGLDSIDDPATTITFNSFATVIPNDDASTTLSRIILDSATLDAADSRELEIRIGSGGAGGNVRMCDPNPDLPVSSPIACN